MIRKVEQISTEAITGFPVNHTAIFTVKESRTTHSCHLLLLAIKTYLIKWLYSETSECLIVLKDFTSLVTSVHIPSGLE